MWQISTSGPIRRPNMRHRTKFRKDWSNRSGDMADFRFFKMAAAAILDFRNFKFLTVRTLKRVELRPHAKFCRNGSKRGWDMAIFQDGGRPPSWIFKSWKFQLPVPFGGPICVSVPNFAKIGRIIPEIWPIFDFSRWWLSAILYWFYGCWDHPRRVIGGLCDYTKFGGNRCRNFDSMQILIFCTLSLKMPIHAPKIGFFWGDFAP